MRGRECAKREQTRSRPPSVVFDFARQVLLVEPEPREEWIYHGDLALRAEARKSEIVCKCFGFGQGKVDLYEVDQMYGVGRCMACSKLHWYHLI
ncbi:MAG: hypothetical protein HQP61_08035 [Peptococcaceae bacterium]|nr:hypothetical protein [Candidatus Syntrophopropionicum ammoniitolerans]